MLTAPLLTDSEINQLIYDAPMKGTRSTAKLSQNGRAGEQVSATIGSGTDFAEVRAYHSGDDLRHIDWRATARSRIPLVRTYHNELSQPLCLLIDRRSAMRFATRVRLKVAQALRMALWIGGREARSNREISAVLLDNPCHWLPPQQGLASLKLIARLANSPCPPIDPDPFHEMSWNKILSGLEKHVPTGSELVLLSDFSGLGDEDNKMLRRLGHHCATRAVRIFDPSEVLIPSSIVSMQLQWGQKKQSLFSTEQMQDEMNARSEAMSRRFHQANIDYFQLSVEQEALSGVLSGVCQ